MTDRVLRALDDPAPHDPRPSDRPAAARRASRTPSTCDAVLEKAAERGVAVELNADPHRLDLDWRLHPRSAIARRAPSRSAPTRTRRAGSTTWASASASRAREASTADEVLNARSADDVLAFARARRRGAMMARGSVEGEDVTAKKPTRRRSGSDEGAAARGARLPAHAGVSSTGCSRAYPDAHCALDFTQRRSSCSCATILSAQCTDKRVNMVTPALFARYPDAAALAAARPEERRGDHPDHRLLPQQGEEPDRHGDRRSWSGTAARCPPTWRRSSRCPAWAARRRTSILGNAFGRNDGIVVDTHVTRLSQPARAHGGRRTR